MTQIPQAIAWTLIHFCWQAAAIAAAYRVLSVVIARRVQPNSLSAGTLSALLLMLVAAVITFAWEMRPDRRPSTSIADSATQPSRHFRRADFPRSTAPGHRRHSQPIPERLTLASLLPWIDGLWLLGVFALSVRSLGGWWYLRRLRLASTVEAPPPFAPASSRISTTLGLTPHRYAPSLQRHRQPRDHGNACALSCCSLSAPPPRSAPTNLKLSSPTSWPTCAAPTSSGTFCRPSSRRSSSSIPRSGGSAPASATSASSAATIWPSPSAPTRSSMRMLSFDLEEQRSRHLRLAMALDGHQAHATLRMRIARILGEPMTRIPSRRLRPFSLVAACAGLAGSACSGTAVCWPASTPSRNPSPDSSACSRRDRRTCCRTHIAAPVIAAEVAVHYGQAISSPAAGHPHPIQHQRRTAVRRQGRSHPRNRKATTSTA